MMNEIDKFPDCGKLAIAYRDCISAIETNQVVLWKYIRGEKCDNGIYRPIFLSGAEAILQALERDELRLQEIEADAKEFTSLMGEFKSIRELAQGAHHENMKIQGAEKACRKILEKEMSSNYNQDPAEVLQMQSVRDQYLARDKVVAESKLEEYRSKMASCNRILEKY